MAKEVFKIVTNEKKEEADILIFGFIGSNWWDEDDVVSDLDFTQAFSELVAKYPRVNICINSGGGSMVHGNAIISAIRDHEDSCDIHTYNKGLAASMAADIFLTPKKAENRHMDNNALLMIHSPSTWASGNAKQLRTEADLLDKFEKTAISVMADALGISEDVVKEKFYDYEDHWFNAVEALAEGFIAKVESSKSKSNPQAARLEYQKTKKFNNFNRIAASLVMPNKSIKMEGLDRLKAVLGYESLEMNDGGIFIPEADAQKLEAGLQSIAQAEEVTAKNAELVEANTKLEQEKNALDVEKSALTTERDAFATQIDELKKEVARLEALPGDTHTKKKKPKLSKAGEEKPYFNPKASHNQDASKHV